METLFQTIRDEAAKHAAECWDSAMLGILDKALGAGNWTLRDVQIHGVLHEHANRTEVLWDGKKLATIHRHQQWEETVFGVDSPGLRWTIRLSVCQHVEHVEAPLG
jgi:hypothetical protein